MAVAGCGVTVRKLSINPSVPIESSIGRQVDASKSDLISRRYASEIRDLLIVHGVLCFPGVWLDDEEQLEFAKSIGEIKSDWDVSSDGNVNGNNRLAEYQKSSIFWHFDGFGVDIPEFATIMSPRILENGKGGATEFADCYAAFEELPDTDKQLVDRLWVWHSFETQMRNVNPQPTEQEVEAWRHGGPPHIQPFVWHHGSGRKSLLLGGSANMIEGMEPRAAAALIRRLNAWITQPRYVFRYSWQLGDLVMWDNTGTLHRAVPYASDSKRLMHRTTIAGWEKPA